MDYIETLNCVNFGSFNLVMQLYEDEYEKEIYNVSIECDCDECITKTLDIYESEDKDKCFAYYLLLKAQIEKTNGIKIQL